MGPIMVPLQRMLVSYYRLSIVALQITEAVSLQFPMQIVMGAVSTYMRNEGTQGGPN